MAEIEFRADGFRERAAALQGSRELVLTRLNQMLRKVGQALIGHGKGSGPLGQATPVVTGKLRNSTTGQILRLGNGAMRLEIRQNARTDAGYLYGMGVIGGTRPHIIRPVRARALRFMIGGRVVFAKLVHHPGNAPNPYPIRVLGEQRGRIQEIVNKGGFDLAADLWKPNRNAPKA